MIVICGVRRMRSKQRHAGKVWTAVLNEDELPAAGRRLVEILEILMGPMKAC